MIKKRCIALVLCAVMNLSMCMPTSATELLEDKTEKSEISTETDLGLNQETDDSDFEWNGTTITAYKGNADRIAIPSKCTSIGAYAFQGCKELVNIIIPEGVTKIGYAAFAECNKLQRIKIPTSVTNIGDDISYLCNPERITIYCYKKSAAYRYAVDNSYKYVVLNADSELAVKSVEINKEDVKYFAGGKVYTYNVNDIVVGNEYILSATVLPDDAFDKSVTWTSSNEAVAKIGSNDGKMLTVAGGTTTITATANDGSGKTASVEINVEGETRESDFEWDGTTITKYIGESDRVYIPEKCTAIGEKAFFYEYPELWYGSGVKELYIPESVTQIGEYAFAYNNVLKKVQMPEGLISIGKGAFKNCEKLNEIKIPNNVTEIAEETFEDCSSLTKIAIPDNTTKIGERAFTGCSDLTTIEIPNGVTEIAEETFKKCNKLSVIDVPNGVTKIGKCAFAGCSNLTQIKISDSVTEIAEDAFSECTELQSIVVNDNNPAYTSEENCNAIIEKSTKTLVQGCKNTVIPLYVTTIGEKAFWNCLGLTQIDIPASVTSIQHNPFIKCDNLESIHVSEDNSVYTSGANNDAIIEKATNSLIIACKNTVITEDIKNIGEDAFEYSKLTEITIPEGVRNIEKYAFYGCGNLTKVIIPSSVETIGDGAFSRSGLRNVEIMPGAVSIGKGAFGSAVEKITIPASVTNIGGNFGDNTVISCFKGSCAYEYAMNNGQRFILMDENTTTSDEAYYKWDGTSIIKYMGANKYVTVPSTCTSIKKDAFDLVSFDEMRGLVNDVYLSKIEIPESVTNIEKGAFNEISAGYFGHEFNPEIYCYKDSEAYKYAEEHDLEIKLLDDVDELKDDVLVESITINTEDFDLNNLVAGEKYKLSASIFPENASNKEITWASLYGDVLDISNTGELVTHKLGTTTIIAKARGGINTYSEVNVSVTSPSKGIVTPEFEWDGTTLVKYNGHSENVVIPDKCTAIGEGAFENCSKLKEIELPASLTEIGSFAFRGCSSLTDIEIPAGVAKIGNYAFERCSSLTNIKIPESVIEIGTNPFADCENIQSITVSKDNTAYTDGDGNNVIIDKNTNALISGCRNSVIPSSVTEIGDSAFAGCSELAMIELSEKITVIGEGAFRGCSSLADIKIPSSVTEIGDSAFADCRKLAKIELPEKITVIGWGTFSECSSLADIKIPSSVTEIGFVK